MANHKSSKKRIRQTLTRSAPTTVFTTRRHAMRRESAPQHHGRRAPPRPCFPGNRHAGQTCKHNIVHKNKAANLKSAIQLHVNAL